MERVRALWKSFPIPLFSSFLSLQPLPSAIKLPVGHLSASPPSYPNSPPPPLFHTGAEPQQSYAIGFSTGSLRFLPHLQLWMFGSLESSWSSLANRSPINHPAAEVRLDFLQRECRGWAERTQAAAGIAMSSVATKGILLKYLYLCAHKKPASLSLSPISHQSNDSCWPDLNSYLWKGPLPDVCFLPSLHITNRFIFVQHFAS